jgi:hypothetical protein
MGAPQPVRVRNARDDERETIRALTLKAYAEFASVMEPAAWEGLDAGRRGRAGGRGDSGPPDRGGAGRGNRGERSPLSAGRDAYGGATGPCAWPEIRLLAVDPGRGGPAWRARSWTSACGARGFGSRELGLHTSRSMEAARRLYERMGFVREPELDFQPEGAELVQAFRLDLGGGAGAAAERGVNGPGRRRRPAGVGQSAAVSSPSRSAKRISSLRWLSFSFSMTRWR